MTDDRLPLRVFIASSAELSPERDALEAAIEKDLVEKHPEIARHFVPKAFQWEIDGFGASRSGDINEQIQRSIRFEEMDVVAVLFWKKVGNGTRDELDRALLALRADGRPEVLIYRKMSDLDPGGNEFAEVHAFCSGHVDRGVVVSEFGTPMELAELAVEHLAAIPWLNEKALSSDPPEGLTKAFLFSAYVGLALAAATMLVSTTMSFPDDGTSFWPVLWILGAPPLLAVAALVTRWRFGRLLSGLVAAWRSPRYQDRDLHHVFSTLIPARLLPDRLRRLYGPGIGGDVLRFALVAFLLFAPAFGQYLAIFDEMLVWEYVVGHETVPETPEEQAKAPKDTVRSQYVDRQRSRWPLGLQEPEVKAFQSAADRRYIFVHARGKFGDARKLSPDTLWRRNLGPQVWLPLQPILYLTLFALVLVSQTHGLWRLIRIRREMALPFAARSGPNASRSSSAK